jgi:hypothetical protein
MLSCKDIASELGISRQNAMRIMKTQMRTVNVGKSKSNPRLLVTEDEFRAWFDRTARIQNPPILRRKG